MITSKETIDWKELAKSFPQPRGGKLEFDDELGLVHGVLLCGPTSQNDLDWSEDSINDQMNLINESDWPTPTHDGHFQFAASKTTGGVYNAYRDGESLRGSWAYKPTQIDDAVYDAKFLRKNLAFSPEIEKKELQESIHPENGRTQIERVFAIRNYSLVTVGGTNSSVAEQKQMFKTLDEFQQQNPTLFDQFKTKVLAEQSGGGCGSGCSCSGEGDSAVATLTKENESLKTKLDEAVAKSQELEAKEQKRERAAKVTEEFNELFEAINLDLLPENEAGERLRKRAELTEELLEELVELEPDAATERMKKLAEEVTDMLTIAESFRGESFADSGQQRQRQTTPAVVGKTFNTDVDEYDEDDAF